MSALPCIKASKKKKKKIRKEKESKKKKVCMFVNKFGGVLFK